MFKDKDIRPTLIKEIIKANQGNSFRLVEELAVCDGDARADIALINGKLCGYEIKSDRDTLERLSRQIDAYNKTFDYITIVVGEKYKDVITDEVPNWWGIKVAFENQNGEMDIESIRIAGGNAEVDTRSVLELLWKDEIRILLQSKGIKGLSNKNRRKLRDIAIATIPPKEIREYTRETLKFRKGWRSD
jgi:transcription elongation factor Elf1